MSIHRFNHVPCLAFTWKLGTHSSSEVDVTMRAMELLVRKNAKKESVGDVLVKDLERLKKEVDMLINGML